MSTEQFRNVRIVRGRPGLPGTGVTGAWANTTDQRLATLEAGSGVAVLNDLGDVQTTGAWTPVDGAYLRFNAPQGKFEPFVPQAITVLSAAAREIDGGGVTITTGIKGDFPPFAHSGTITGWALLADQSGSISVGLWKNTLANFPPNSGNLLFSATLSSAARSPTSGSYNSVSHAFAAGDVIRVNVASATSIQRVLVALRLSRAIGP